MLQKNAPNDDGISMGTLAGDRKLADKVLIFEKGPLSGLVRIEMEALGMYFRTALNCCWPSCPLLIAV